jgi:hypothetical protein
MCPVFEIMKFRCSVVFVIALLCTGSGEVKKENAHYYVLHGSKGRS